MILLTINIMKKNYLRLACLMFLIFLLPSTGKGQTLGVSSNALGWAALSPNLGVEFGVAKKWTVSVDGLVNPFTYENGKKSKVWFVQPEVRFWPRHKFSGHAFGLNADYGQYDWAMKKTGYKGDMIGIGASYAYAYPLSKRWNFEAQIGAGYHWLSFDNRYDRKDPHSSIGPRDRSTFGLTKLGIKFTYFIF